MNTQTNTTSFLQTFTSNNESHYLCFALSGNVGQLAIGAVDGAFYKGNITWSDITQDVSTTFECLIFD